MPTEAEWEYAARAGKDTEYAGGDTSLNVAWTLENALEVSHVSCSTPEPKNLFRLCDMSGNVYEWVNDWKADIGSDPVTDPAGGSGTQRVLRGGSWSSESNAATVSARFGIEPATRYPVAGIRIVRTIPD
jgi:formylglycine-generating enzyme required for sulfatase activity